ncbi:MAG: serine hydrolase domain-containing protein [Pseudomonadales bacterium]
MYDETIAAPELLGLDKNRIEDLLRKAEKGVTEGPLPSIQLALAKDDKLAVFSSFGDSDNSQRYNIFSCTKALVASAIWLLMSKGKVDIHQQVCEFIPEFSDNGKGLVTIEQLLCHTAGFPNAPLGPPTWLTREGRLKKMQSWRLNWEPASRMEYHSSSAHWVLAEIIQAATSMDYREYITTEILRPLGLKNLQLGVPLEQQANITTLCSVGSPPSKEELKKLFGVAMEWPEISNEALLRFNEAETRALGVPGGGGVSNAAAVALFYQSLLHNPGGLWDPEILADATSTIRVELKDPATGVAANRGLGVVIAGDDGQAGRRGMAKNVSATSFGHQGVGGQIAWADPLSGISFCVLTNGLDANPIRSAQFGAKLSTLAARCLLE